MVQICAFVKVLSILLWFQILNKECIIKYSLKTSILIEFFTSFWQSIAWALIRVGTRVFLKAPVVPDPEISDSSKSKELH